MRRKHQQVCLADFQHYTDDEGNLPFPFANNWKKEEEEP
jgi:hypothetical protein